MTTEEAEQIVAEAWKLGSYELRLLHEVAHHIAGLDHGHDVDLRCWAVVLHVMSETPVAMSAETEPIRLHCHDHLLS